MILVDTFTWIDYFNGIHSKHTDYRDDAISKDVILVGDIILKVSRTDFHSHIGPHSLFG